MKTSSVQQPPINILIQNTVDVSVSVTLFFRIIALLNPKSAKVSNIAFNTIAILTRPKSTGVSNLAKINVTMKFLN
ncbi:hypothetical protein JCM30204_37420 [Dysgonomonas termitidis]